jgi:hypothetical protein
MSILESDSLPPAEELAPGMANTIQGAMFRNRSAQDAEVETNFKT